jgi:hypothetical protein
MRAAYIALLVVCAPGAAAAQSWTVTASASGSQADGDESPFYGGGGLSIERSFDTTWVGGALGFTGGDANVPELDASIDQNSIDASVWWGASLGDYDLTLGVNYTRQELDGAFALLGANIDVDGDTTSTGVAATLARTFGDEATLTPSLALGYSNTETDLTYTAGGGGSLDVSESADGFGGAVRLDGAAPIGDRVVLLGGLAFVATDNASAQTYAGGGERSWSRQRDDEGSASWGEVNVGLELELTESSFLSGSLGSTIGRDQEETFGSLSLSWSF